MRNLLLRLPLPVFLFLGLSAFVASILAVYGLARVVAGEAVATVVLFVYLIAVLATLAGTEA